MEFKEFAKERKRMCKHFAGCLDCPLFNMEEESLMPCSRICLDNPEKAQAIVSKWAKEHPVITNFEKYKQVMEELFGAKVSIESDGIKFFLDHGKGREWWNEPYKEKK